MNIIVFYFFYSSNAAISIANFPFSPFFSTSYPPLSLNFQVDSADISYCRIPPQDAKNSRCHCSASSYLFTYLFNC